MKKVIATCLIFFFLISCGGSPPPATTPTSGGQVFQRTKIVRNEGDKSVERDIHFEFTDAAILIQGREAALGIKYEIPYDKVTQLKYEKSKHLRLGATLLVSALFLFSKSKKHWLMIYYNTPEEKEDFVILRLDKRNYQMILSTIETKTGVKVERYEES
jgi:hypothetical protein